MGDPKKILWSERDVGQRFSIIMGTLLFVGFTGFMAFTGVQAALNGDWWSLIAPIGFVLVAIGILRDWRRRNAR